MARKLPWNLRSQARSIESNAREAAINRTSLAEHDSPQIQEVPLGGLFCEAGIRRARCDVSNRSDWVSCFFDECARHSEIKRQASILPRRFWETEMDINKIVQFVWSKWDTTDEYPQEWVVFTKEQEPCFRYELVVRCDLDARSIECLQVLLEFESKDGNQPGPSVRLGYSIVAAIDFEEQQDGVVLSSSGGEQARPLFVLGGTRYGVSAVFFYCGTREAAVESNDSKSSNSGGGVEMELDSSSDYEENVFSSSRKGSKIHGSRQRPKKPKW